MRGYSCYEPESLHEYQSVLINAQFIPKPRAADFRKTQFPGTDTAISGRRYCSPSQGRFLGRDPIDEAGGLNLYGFCGNNGVNRWDVLGLSWHVEFTNEGSFKAFSTDANGNSGWWNFGSLADAERWAAAWEAHDLSIVGDRHVTSAYLNNEVNSNPNPHSPNFPSQTIISFSAELATGVVGGWSGGSYFQHYTDPTGTAWSRHWTGDVTDDGYLVLGRWRREIAISQSVFNGRDTFVSANAAAAAATPYLQFLQQTKNLEHSVNIFRRTDGSYGYTVAYPGLSATSSGFRLLVGNALNPTYVGETGTVVGSSHSHPTSNLFSGPQGPGNLFGDWVQGITERALLKDDFVGMYLAAPDGQTYFMPASWWAAGSPPVAHRVYYSPTQYDIMGLGIP